MAFLVSDVVRTVRPEHLKAKWEPVVDVFRDTTSKARVAARRAIATVCLYGVSLLFTVGVISLR